MTLCRVRYLSIQLAVFLWGDTFLLFFSFSSPQGPCGRFYDFETSLHVKDLKSELSKAEEKDMSMKVKIHVFTYILVERESLYVAVVLAVLFFWIAVILDDTAVVVVAFNVFVVDIIVFVEVASAFVGEGLPSPFFCCGEKTLRWFVLLTSTTLTTSL